MTQKTTVILPAKDEQAGILQMVTSLLRLYPNEISRIIVVDDGSQDATESIVRNLARRDHRIILLQKRPPNGVGHALRYGVQYALKHSSDDLFLLMDADFLANVPEVKMFLKNIDHFDGIIGSRYMQKGQLVHYPHIKKLSNRLFHLFLRVFLGICHSDVSNNYKLYRRHVFSTIPFKAGDFAVNAETGIFPILSGLNIGEISVKWVEREEGMGVSKFKILRLAPGYLFVFLRAFAFRLKKHFHGFILTET